jgi:chaperonin GroEL (HSP60 family)
MVAEDIRLGTDARERMLHGIDILTDAVRVTLGRRAAMSFSTRATARRGLPRTASLSPKEIEFSDKFENLGAQMMREVASKTNSVAGDGTTTPAGAREFFAAAAPRPVRRRSRRSGCEDAFHAAELNAVFARWGASGDN